MPSGGSVPPAGPSEPGTRLFISPRTVDHHLRSIYRKFGITSRAELVLLAGQLTGS
jgi:DNA-binding CsgD family transcriptional regulator